jgi:magnesium and cobalt transporter
MNDSYPSRRHTDKPHEKRSLIERLSDFISPEPDSRGELLKVLQDAHARDLIDADSLSMIEGVFQVSDLCARDIMVPRAQMDAINIAESPEQFIPFVLDKAHSRYPVYEGNRDNVIGVLLAKDLLRYYAEEDFDVRDMLRPAVFIPESKRLNVLLHDFRVNQNHIAIVVDEYGGVAGLITIEDVLEQIVGDIEDEYDFDEESGNIIASPDGRYRVRALTEIEQFNETFGTSFSDEEVDTIGGLVTHHFGRVPHRGERVRIGDLIFEILRGDARQIHVLLVRRDPFAGQREREAQHAED